MTFNDTLKEVYRLFSIHPRDVVSNHRYSFILPARFALCYALRANGLSYKAIGRRLHRDHSSVIHACRRAEEMMERDPGYTRKVEALVEFYRKPYVEQPVVIPSVAEAAPAYA